MNRLKSKRGSVLVGTISLSIVGAAIIAGYLSMTMNEYKLSQRTLMLQSAMNLAEAGLEEGMDAINLDDWSGWSAVDSNGFFREITNIPFLDTRSGSFSIYIEDHDSLPILVSEGRIENGPGGTLSKQIRVDMRKTGLFVNGLTAKDTISFNGNNITVDAYDSTIGLWNHTLNREDEGSVASLSIDNGDLDVGNGDIWGYLATGGGTFDIGPHGSVTGEDTPHGVTEDPNRISYDFYANLPDIGAPGLVADHTTLAAGDIGVFGASWSSSPVVYHLTSFSMSGTNVINVVGPTVIIVDGDFSMAGSAELNILGTDSYLKMYVGGDLSLAGQGVLNDALNPEGFQVWGTALAGAGQSVKVVGNGDTAGIVYAPNADVEVVGNGNVSGAVVGNNIKMTGNAAFHYDVNLKNMDDEGSLSISRWRELRSAGERVDFTDRTALSAAIEPL